MDKVFLRCQVTNIPCGNELWLAAQPCECRPCRLFVGAFEQGEQVGREQARAALLNTPEFRDFASGVVLEALHQRERWGTEHDAVKTDADWFWLIGYLAGKALYNPGPHARTDDREADSEEFTNKRLHRIVTAAAALANWHAQILGKSNMRPGIQAPAGAEK